MLEIPVTAPPREVDLAGLAGMLAQSLPTGSDVVVYWDDERLGAGSSELEGVAEALQARARQLVAGERPQGGGGALIDESWSEGEARIAIAARLPEPLTPGSREAWRALARRLVSATIASAQAEARIDSLRKSERLQQALYEIADLAGSGLEMEEMLKRRHLAPSYGKKTQLAWEKQDYLLIDAVPDIFVTGHVHGAGVTSYKGIRMINASTWQDQTSFQKTHNFVPDPAKLIMVHLGTGRTSQADF